MGPLTNTRSRFARELSVRRIFAPGHLAGYTLAEVLVVLIVIGLAAALVYARFDSDPRAELEREGRRLGAAIEHAALLAQWHNETLGVSAVGGNYRFWRRGANSGDDWSALSGDDVLAARTLPTSFAVAVRAYAAQPVARRCHRALAAPAAGTNRLSSNSPRPNGASCFFPDPINRVTVSTPSLR